MGFWPETTDMCLGGTCGARGGQTAIPRRSASKFAFAKGLLRTSLRTKNKVDGSGAGEVLGDLRGRDRIAGKAQRRSWAGFIREISDYNSVVGHAGLQANSASKGRQPQGGCPRSRVCRESRFRFPRIRTVAPPRLGPCRRRVRHTTSKPLALAGRHYAAL